MKKIIATAAAAGLVLAIAGASFAATPSQNSGPTQYQVKKLQIVRALEQKQEAQMPTSTTIGSQPYTHSETAVDNLLNRLYNGEPVSDQEIDNALRR